jgi:outer membrane protein OmpA-like peptidoglycan-associated protein
MKLPAVLVRAACGATLATIGGNALSLPGPHMLGRYDFGYAIRGDRAARPVQVFDDGVGKVYFEVRPGQPMPAVFAGKDLELLALQADGPFYTARSAASEFTLALGAARATVARGDAALGGETLAVAEVAEAADLAEGRDASRAKGSGGSDRGRLLASADPGLPAGVHFDAGAVPAPRLLGGAPDPAAPDYAIPVRGDVVEWVDPGITHVQPVVFAVGSAALGTQVRSALGVLAVRIGHEAAVIVEGRGDASAKEGLEEARANAVRAALVSQGLPAANVSVRPASTAGAFADAGEAQGRVAGAAVRWTTPGRAHAPSSPAATPPAARFDIRPSDRDIAGALRRWARAAGYEVVWELEWTAPVTGAALLEAPSFRAAVEEVVAGLRAQGYPIRARAYADRVIRFSTPQ